MGVPEKFGLAICYPWKIVSTFFEERKNCHKVVENYKAIAPKIQGKYCHFSYLHFPSDSVPRKRF